MSNLVIAMKFTRVIGVVVWLINAVVISPSSRKASGAVQQLADLSSASIAITNVTVIDVITGAHRTNVTVLIRNARIDAIAPIVHVPPDATPVDGKSRFLIPGLWDMHTHHQGTGAD
jgi:adenine deaminase